MFFLNVFFIVYITAPNEIPHTEEQGNVKVRLLLLHDLTFI